jgi:hypothetical protein
MELSTFQTQAEQLTEQLRTLIENNLPSKGLISEDCQQRYLLNTLSSFEQAVNGTESIDLQLETGYIMVDRTQEGDEVDFYLEGFFEGNIEENAHPRVMFGVSRSKALVFDDIDDCIQWCNEHGVSCAFKREALTREYSEAYYVVCKDDEFLEFSDGCDAQNHYFCGDLAGAKTFDSTSEAQAVTDSLAFSGYARVESHYRPTDEDR